MPSVQTDGDADRLIEPKGRGQRISYTSIRVGISGADHFISCILDRLPTPLLGSDLEDVRISPSLRYFSGHDRLARARQGRGPSQARRRCLPSKASPLYVSLGCSASVLLVRSTSAVELDFHVRHCHFAPVGHCYHLAVRSSCAHRLWDEQHRPPHSRDRVPRHYLCRPFARRGTPNSHLWAVRPLPDCARWIQRRECSGRDVGGRSTRWALLMAQRLLLGHCRHVPRLAAIRL